MATLLLAAAGGAIGNAIGGTVLGISAVAIGQAAGATLGRAIDAALFTPTQRVAGPRLDSATTQNYEEGAGLPVVDGRTRVAGTVMWSTRLLEVSDTSSQGGGLSGGPRIETTEYSYFANFAVALTDCTAGPVRYFGRIWADGKLLDTSELTIRYYHGTETQSPDPLMVAKDGAAPAYRGTAYVVFENFPILDYGRRIPTMQFEVWGQSGEVENLIQGVDMIPSSTEFGYSPTVITKTAGDGETARENAIRDAKTSDWELSLDQMQASLPNCDTVALVVAWFGTDLRAGFCEIEPRVETAVKETSRPWSAGGLSRGQATVVSQVDGGPAFGSTPDDQSVIDAIQDIRARGMRVVLYPFIMMDIEQGNTLPHPDTGAAGQPAYPWRGRIRPATGSDVDVGMASLLGTAAPGDFSSGSGVPVYSGPSEWSYRRFILHLASLARAAGGVDAFLVGSELVSLTTARATSGAYPFVDGLVQLASDVKGMIPTAAVSYAADWSEYHSDRDGVDVTFHLDPFWSSPDVDFVGIDNYLPLSDWRPGADHLDYDPDAGFTSPYSLEYLKSNIEGGEYWDWFYATPEDRAAQVRTSIQDGAYGEDWVFRQKAIKDWQANAHHNRPGGVRDSSPTAWVPGSKPVWFTEYGCPAVDLGSNQPNVFYDPKSSEGALPHFSTGVRDDFMQRQCNRATLEWWRDNGGSVVSSADMFAWAWDSRPWPEFPRLSDVWTDGPNFERGHWLNARTGSAPAAEVIQRRLEAYYGYTPADLDLTACYGQLDGVNMPGPLSFREMMGTFETALHLVTSEYEGVLEVSARSAARAVVSLGVDDLVADGDGPLYQITRASVEETPRVAHVRFSDADRDFQPGFARATIRENPGQAEASADLAVVSDLSRMTGVAEMVLRVAAESRETIELPLPPSSTLRPGEVFSFTPRNGRPIRFIANEVVRGVTRKVKGSLYTSAAYGAAPGPARPALALVAPASETAAPFFLDLPLLPGMDMQDHQGVVAFHSNPWPGGVDLHRSTSIDTGYGLNVVTGRPGTTGVTSAPLSPGRLGVWSSEVLEVRLSAGSLVSRPEDEVLSGRNGVAVEHAPGVWEVLQFRDAELFAPDYWRLSGLIRGQLGTEWTRDPGGLPSGARVVVLDEGLSSVDMEPGDIGRQFYWRAVPSGSDVVSGDVATHAFSGVGRRPYAPVHLEAIVSGGDLVVSWVRRTRIEGDPWGDGTDVPLGEAFERYQVEVGPVGSPDLSVIVNDTQTATLAVSGLSGPHEVRVSQVSETYGPGPAAAITLDL